MEKIVPVEEGAEAFIEMLAANDVDYIFLNPGTASVSIQEALAKYEALGKKAPKVVLGLHESVAMSAAHGYFMISGKPQAMWRKMRFINQLTKLVYRTVILVGSEPEVRISQDRQGRKPLSLNASRRQARGQARYSVRATLTIS